MRALNLFYLLLLASFLSGCSEELQMSEDLQESFQNLEEVAEGELAILDSESGEILEEADLGEMSAVLGAGSGVDEAMTKTVTLVVKGRNSGVGSAKLSLLDSEGALKVSEDQLIACELSLRSRGSCAVELHFDPSGLHFVDSVVNRDGDIRSFTNALRIVIEGRERLFSLKGGLFLNRSSYLSFIREGARVQRLNFGSVIEDELGSRETIIVQNNSRFDLPLSGALISASTENKRNSYAVMSDTCSGSLSAGASCEVQVRFQPQMALDVIDSELSISLDASGLSVQGLSNDRVAIANTGNGKGPGLRLEGRGMGRPMLAVNSNNLNFGDVLIDSSEARTLTISNSGGSTLSLSALKTGSNDFTINPNIDGVSLEPGESQNIQVSFSPDNSGTESASIRIDGYRNQSESISLSGNGVAEAMLSVNPNSLSFGEVAAGSNRELSVSVSNLGDQNLRYSSSIQNAQGTGLFAIRTNASETLSGRESRNIMIRFTPSGDGASSSSADLMISASGMSAVVSLSGEEALATPTPPSNLVVQAMGENQIDLSFNDNSNNEESFELQRQVNSGSFSTLATLAANASSYSDSGLSAGTTYGYRIRAVNSAGSSSFSNTASAITDSANRAPTLSIISPSNNQSFTEGSLITFSVNARDADGNLDRIELYQGGNRVLQQNVPESSNASAEQTLTGLTEGSHVLLAQVFDSQGLNSQQSVSINIEAAPSPPSGGDKPLLPIRVLGVNNPNATQEVSLRIDRQIQEQIKYVWLQTHAINYEDKAGFRLNQSNWLSLDHNNTQIIGTGETLQEAVDHGARARQAGGMNGGFHSLHLLIDTDDLSQFSVQDEELNIGFRHQYRDLHLSIGYRIIKLRLLDENYQDLIDPDQYFEYDDPTQWQMPLGEEHIADGRSLWRNAELINPTVSGFPTIKARCMDCHARDGRDLKYFNYSNQAIIERSKFHGLSEEEGQKIATYVRSLDIPVVPQAAPYNPPYQPGPGLDDKPVYEWAAGAGLDMVLNEPTEMLPYQFPDAVNPDGSLDPTKITPEKLAFNSSGNPALNLRELPVFFQMPDWNHWLPKVHPKDADESVYNNHLAVHFYDGSGTGSLFDRSGIRSADEGYNIRDDFQSGVIPWRDMQGWTGQIENFSRHYGRDANKSQYQNNLERYSAQQWAMTKAWEVAHEFEMEDKGLEIYDSPTAERRSWWGNSAWLISPRKLKLSRDNHSINEGLASDFSFFSFSWYYLQFLHGCGFGSNGGQNPCDFKYMWAYVVRDGPFAGEHKGYFFFTLFSKMLAWFSGSTEVGPGPGRLEVRGPNPSVFLKFDSPTMFESEEVKKAYINAYMHNYIDLYESMDPSPAIDNNAVLEDKNCYFGPLQNLLKCSMQPLRDGGVDPGVMDRVENFYETIYPNIDF